MTEDRETRIAAWAKKKLADELTWVREASTASRRAYHEGVAATLAYACGENDRALALMTTILVDYTGARNTGGREGVKAGAMMVRGVADYLAQLGDENAAA